MAYAHIKRSEPPPVISIELRDGYIDALEDADRGDLEAFSNFLADLATVTSRQAVRLGHRALEGRLNRPERQ